MSWVFVRLVCKYGPNPNTNVGYVQVGLARMYPACTLKVPGQYESAWLARMDLAGTLNQLGRFGFESVHELPM